MTLHMKDCMEQEENVMSLALGANEMRYFAYNSVTEAKSVMRLCPLSVFVLT